MNEKAAQPELGSKRYFTKEPARIDVYGKKEVLFCRMNNLSSTGAFFELLNPTYIPRIGDLVRMTINLKQVNKTHVVNGEVVWFKGSGLGVSFIKQKELFTKLSK
ncbi:MAG: PilZ domain-containing protein [Pseudobdellovibrio sp.]